MLLFLEKIEEVYTKVYADIMSTIEECGQKNAGVTFPEPDMKSRFFFIASISIF